MNTDQCVELKDTIAAVKDSDVEMIVLMGGENFFRNGIHLNWIEASVNPALESWNNINAIDDLILEVIDTPEQITISALRNNAGAGGVILALACDEVIIHQGIVLNPHYKTMGLFGSEYWTTCFPNGRGTRRRTSLPRAVCLCWPKRRFGRAWRIACSKKTGAATIASSSSIADNWCRTVISMAICP